MFKKKSLIHKSMIISKLFHIVYLQVFLQTFLWELDDILELMN